MALRRRRPLTFWLVVLLVLAAGSYYGSRWVLTILYPLDYREEIFARSREFGLDPYLVAAVIRTESKFRPEARSSQGARGLMQIMPETAEWIAGQLEIPFAPEWLDRPDYNVRLGSWYLRDLLRQFEGDTVLALAAYNGGRTNVQKWLKERQWTGEQRTLDQIPFRETRTYVDRVLRNHDMYRRLYAP